MIRAAVVPTSFIRTADAREVVSIDLCFGLLDGRLAGVRSCITASFEVRNNWHLRPRERNFTCGLAWPRLASKLSGNSPYIAKEVSFVLLRGSDLKLIRVEGALAKLGDSRESRSTLKEHNLAPGN